MNAVDGVSFSINEGETLGLVGESGCGKSVTALSIMKLVPEPGQIVGGDVLFRNKDLLKMPDEDLRKIRGKQMAMIFQDPTASLNPVFTVGDQISEVSIAHQNMSKSDAWLRAAEMLKTVGVPSPDQRVSNYPHEFSGGMRQRAMIAMGLTCEPSLLIADEPTTNLDVTIQAQILELMKEMKSKFKTSILLITHDMGIVAETCDKVAIMYAGEIVEYGETDEIFFNPKHPYTQKLMECIPRGKKLHELQTIAGSVPDLIKPPTGCKFHPRCPMAFDICSKERSILKETVPNHTVSCHLYD